MGQVMMIRCWFLGTRGMCSSERFACVRVATWYILGY